MKLLNRFIKKFLFVFICIDIVGVFFFKSCFNGLGLGVVWFELLLLICCGGMYYFFRLYFCIIKFLIFCLFLDSGFVGCVEFYSLS